MTVLCISCVVFGVTEINMDDDYIDKYDIICILSTDIAAWFFAIQLGSGVGVRLKVGDKY